MLTTKELREKRAKLAEEARVILDTAAKDKREALRSDEEEKFQALHAEIDKLKKHIDLREKQDEEEQRLSEPLERRADPGEPGGNLHDPSAPHRLRRGEDDARTAFCAWFQAGSPRPIEPHQREAAQRVGLDLNNKNLNIYLRGQAPRDLRSIPEWEQRAQSTATGGAGGFTVADETMRGIESALLTFGGMRSVADVIRTSTGADLPWPMNNDTSNKGRIVGQNVQVTATDLVFTQMVLQSFKYSSDLILVSVEFLQDSSINAAAFIGEALGTRIGRITNQHFTTGTGSGEPNGVVTASALGKTGASGQTTTVVYDDLVDLEHSVDPAYRGSARFMFNDSTLKSLKKIKIPQFSGDTAGMPLWQPGMSQGSPDTILGYPYVINQDMATMAASAKSILFGDFSKYKVRDVTEINLLRLDERYAEFHQVAFLAFSRHDGDLLNAGTNPIKHYINAAS